MEAVKELLGNPLVWKLYVSFLVYSALVSAIPSPEQVVAQLNGSALSSGGKIVILFYRFLFGFLHSLQGNLNRAAIAFKVPGAKEE